MARELIATAIRAKYPLDHVLGGTEGFILDSVERDGETFVAVSWQGEEYETIYEWEGLREHVEVLPH
jgi:hypothetical protein